MIRFYLGVYFRYYMVDFGQELCRILKNFLENHSSKLLIVQNSRLSRDNVGFLARFF